MPTAVSSRGEGGAVLGRDGGGSGAGGRGEGGGNEVTVAETPCFSDV